MAEKPALNLRFLYAFCNDVAAMRRFYTELLGMSEGNFMDSEQWGWLTCRSEGLELMFFRLDGKTPVAQGWAWQPGGTVEDAVPRMSFSVQVPWPQYADTVKRLRNGAVRTQSEHPVWRQQSYWGWTVADPMGNTIEVYSTPPEKPAGENPNWDETP
jgi:catechol 2,3-dioxygenase-like lactoylglutathione lyase family enzyme